MQTWPMQNVIEPVPVADIYCSGIVAIEKLPYGNVRLWGATSQARGGTGPIENVVTTKTVMPEGALIGLVLMAMAAVDADSAGVIGDAVAAACGTIHH